MKVALRLISIIIVIVFVAGCRKKVEMPDAEAEKLFGSWQWIQTSGGFSGGTTNPTTEGHTKKIEFSNKGICKQYKNDDLENKQKYEVSMGRTIYSTDEAYLLKFKRGGIVKNKDLAIAQSIVFYGQDTLVLRDECSDCYQTTYVRIK